MITQMQIKGLMFDPYNNAYIVVLRDEEHSDMLPIWVGKSEAGAISMSLENVTSPRPMTHDLIRNILAKLDTSGVEREPGDGSHAVGAVSTRGSAACNAAR